MDMTTLITLAVLAALLGAGVFAWNQFEASPETGNPTNPGDEPAQRKDSDNDADRRNYEERTYDELYSLAMERDIEGRSTMKKAELIKALRKA